MVMQYAIKARRPPRVGRPSYCREFVFSKRLFALTTHADTSDGDNRIQVAALLDAGILLLELGEVNFLGHIGETGGISGAGAGFLAAGKAAYHGHEGDGENDFLHFHGVVF